MEKLGVKVYYSSRPEGECIGDIYPKSRADEISSVRNDRLRREKFHVWKLLEYALGSCGIDMREIDFKKLENGKWISDRICFSLSHTDGLAAVAISDNAVGIDVEIVSGRAARIAKKAFSEVELGDMDSLCEDEKNLYTTRLWTAKEAIFKSLDERVFIPQSIEISKHSVKTVVLEVVGEKYALSVAGSGAEDAEFTGK